MDFIAIDFETANEDRASACALGIAYIRNGNIEEQKYFLIKPPNLYFNHYNVAVHGIRAADVIDKPIFAELWPSLKQYFENRVVISHNASFDMSVLRAVLNYYNIPYPNLNYSCTWIMSKKHWPGQLSYKLNEVAAMLDIKFKHHHALEDAIACALIAQSIFSERNVTSFDELSLALDLSVGSLYPGGYIPAKSNTKSSRRRKSKEDAEANLHIYDSRAFKKFNMLGQIDRAIQTLEGIITGIAMDGVINKDEIAELEYWYQLNQSLLKKRPLLDLVNVLDEALMDLQLSDEEKADILWLCKNIHSDSEYYDILTADIQKLHGILHGILADNIINQQEIKELDDWLSENTHLASIYPYDELCSLITVILKDGALSNDEAELLKAFFSQFINTRYSYNLNEQELKELKITADITGICAMCPEVLFKDKIFCFTGVSSKAKRSDIKNLIEDRGGIFKNTIVKNTSYLVVGNEGNPCWTFSCYGRKVEQAMNLRKSGSKILIVHENDFWDEIS